MTSKRKHSKETTRSHRKIRSHKKRAVGNGSVAAKNGNGRVTTRISENLHWMAKYLHRTKRHMPSLPLPRQIRSYRAPLHREMRVLGTCAVETRVITLATHRIVSTKSGKRRRHVAIPRRELLMTLAHEMAHLRYGRHDYEQESYARTIFQTFGLKDPCPHCGGSGSIVARYIN